ncbi:MAG: hypothetical protein WA160_16265 [Pseudobdellovibrio sp.]
MNQQYKQPLLTIVIIFATAYILTLIGCAPKGGSDAAAPVPNIEAAAPDLQPQNPTLTDEDLQEIDPKDMRECTTDEFKTLIDWSNSLAASNKVIQSMGASSASWKQKADFVQIATLAMNKCDDVQFYHSKKPCKKTEVTIINPTKPILKYAYDAARIHKRCALTEQYLNKFGLRPDNAGAAPANSEQNPYSPGDSSNSGTVEDVNSLRECSIDEFSKLKLFRSALDQANKNIDKLGTSANWKYDANSIEAAQVATSTCEVEIKYHQAQPCKRAIKNETTNQIEVKVYAGDTLRQQCQKARSYNYEFAQRSESLITSNAKLILDTSLIANKTITSGESNITVGQCVVSNVSAATVTYQGQKTLVTEARVYPNQEDPGYQMFVMLTAEGVKFECYGLDYTSLKTSKNEVVRLLKQKNTNINLSYELN